jgi:hypothetical protein
VPQSPASPQKFQEFQFIFRNTGHFFISCQPIWGDEMSQHVRNHVAHKCLHFFQTF